MRRKIEKIVPRYAWGPLILAVAVNMAVYEGVALFKDDLTFYSLELPIDRVLPFVATFIVFYLLAFVQWIINYVLIAREGKTFCYRFVYGDVISKLFCLLFFVLLPTTMERPEVVGTSVFDWLVKFIYHVDAPVNLFPSIHCLESWCCIHAAFEMKKVPNWCLLRRFLSNSMFCWICLEESLCLKQDCCLLDGSSEENLIKNKRKRRCGCSGVF